MTGNNLQKKKIKCLRHPANPVIPRTPGTFFSIHAANPDFLKFCNRYFLYFRGQDETGRDQIGVAVADPENFDGRHWQLYSPKPVVPVSPEPQQFDSGYILDPAAIVLNGKVYLYYSAHRIDWDDWNIPSFVGLAISDDGFHFKKTGEPIIFGTAPEVVFFKNRIFLFFQRRGQKGEFEIYCCPSRDGIHFPERDVEKVFGPTGHAGDFDSFSISTVRIWQEDDWFFMTYGGCNRYFDYPVAIGLAHSKNLMQWQRYSGNPVLTRGERGTWDEGALWFATLQKIKNRYYIWYEGVGTGLSLNSPAAVQASAICRNQSYGGYKKTTFSQIGLATFQGELTNW